jgi:hypothetical protein
MTVRPARPRPATSEPPATGHRPQAGQQPAAAHKPQTPAQKDCSCALRGFAQQPATRPASSSNQQPIIPNKIRKLLTINYKNLPIQILRVESLCMSLSACQAIGLKTEIAIECNYCDSNSMIEFLS